MTHQQMIFVGSSSIHYLWRSICLLHFGAWIGGSRSVCILGELLRGQPLFPASSESECLQIHAQLLGTPTHRIWPVRESSNSH
jgi:hypothetical protein